MQSDSLIDSAKGWHSIQMAVLGFIGLCGVLSMGETPAGPDWLSWWTMAMSVLAFVCALMSMWMVGSIAFPHYGGGGQPPQNGSGRLRGGIRMTFVAMILMVLGSLTGWWPEGAGEERVEVRDANGASACGTWVDGAPAGSLWLRTADGVVTVSLREVADMRPVPTCLSR